MARDRERRHTGDRDSSVTVRAFAVPHANWAPGHALGYRFETPGRILESHLERRTTDWQRYHRSSHTTAIEVGELAARAHPKLLVLYHLIPTNAKDDAFVSEVRQHYSGAVVVAKDLGVY